MKEKHRIWSSQSFFSNQLHKREEVKRFVKWRVILFLWNFSGNIWVTEIKIASSIFYEDKCWDSNKSSDFFYQQNLIWDTLFYSNTSIFNENWIDLMEFYQIDLWLFFGKIIVNFGSIGLKSLSNHCNFGIWVDCKRNF